MKLIQSFCQQICHQVALRALPAILSMLAFVSVAISAPLQAAQFGVRVFNDFGQPVSGASVCIGLPGNYKQFGSDFTNDEGLVLIEVPNVPLVVTISKTRFSGLRINQPARSYTLVKDVTLSEGVPGPRCLAGSSMAEAPSSVQIGNIDIIETPNAYRLDLKVSGEPTHYRLGSTSQFTDGNWIAYKQPIYLSNALSNRGKVFVQLRRVQGTSTAWVESRSDVVEVQMAKKSFN